MGLTLKSFSIRFIPWWILFDFEPLSHFFNLHFPVTKIARILSISNMVDSTTSPTTSPTISTNTRVCPHLTICATAFHLPFKRWNLAQNLFLGVDAVLDHSLYPDREYQLRWLSNYIRLSQAHEKGLLMTVRRGPKSTKSSLWSLVCGSTLIIITNEGG